MSSLCMLCTYVTLFLFLIMFLAFRVINNGKVSRKVFIELLAPGWKLFISFR